MRATLAATCPASKNRDRGYIDDEPPQCLGLFCVCVCGEKGDGCAVLLWMGDVLGLGRWAQGRGMGGDVVEEESESGA